MKMDLNEVQRLLDGAYLKKRTHPHLPLHVLSYTPKTQVDGYWNDYTKMCRGLVIDDRGQVISRPFQKFHHWNQIDLPDEPPIVYDKLDGSLIVVSQYDGKRIVNSQTSFNSEHARVAEDLLGSWQPLEGYTYCFELLHPDMRIVCDYGDQAKLVLLGRVVTWSGAEFPVEWIADWSGPKVMRREINWPWESPDDHAEPNKEGFVLYWPKHGLRAKAKFSEYVRLHGLLTGVSSKRIWELLRSGKGIDKYKQDVPDEFLTWVNTQEAALKEEFQQIKDHVTWQFEDMKEFYPERKAFAKQAKKLPHWAPLLMLYNGKSIDDLIWGMIEPKGSKSYWNADLI